MEWYLSQKLDKMHNLMHNQYDVMSKVDILPGLDSEIDVYAI